MNSKAATATFLFTDLENSTPLWENHPDLMQELAARHDLLIREAVEAHRGQVVRSTGDGFFAVFNSASDGVAAALTGQQAILAESWPSQTGPLRVRMGLHTGESRMRDGDYYGTEVNRAARVMGLAHGGQVLVSEATAALIRKALPPQVSLADRGSHRLKGLAAAEQIIQLIHPALPFEFPPLKSLSAYQHNLPVQLSSFVGRQKELSDVKRLLKETHLLTLLGPGGTGKTRLMLEVAEEVVADFANGVWLVELAPLTDPDLIAERVAAALKVQEQPGRPIRDTLVDHLRNKESLLLLDNVEHLVRESAALAEHLLTHCPRLHILVTGREALFIQGEVTLQIPSLTLPSSNGEGNLEAIRASESVQLFLARAQEFHPDFELTPENTAAIAEIVRRLDGIPLALELATARLRMLSVDQIAERLSDRFRLLTGGRRTAMPRQQTLQAMIDWSWNLLDEKERLLLQRLSVFSGGWSLEAAQTVASDDVLDEYDVFDLLEQLVNKSLVTVNYPDSGEARYGMLESIRQYAQERLAKSEEKDEFGRSHAEYHLNLAAGSYGQMWGPTQRFWLAKLESEHDNLRAALEWLGRETGHAEMMLRLAGSLWRFWEIRGYISEGRAWLDRALAANPDAPTYLRANGLRGAGMLARQQGDYAQAKAMHKQSLTLFQKLEHRLGIARELDALGEIEQYLGDYPQAIKLHQDSLALRREIDDQEGIAASLGQLGTIARDRGQYQYANELFEESLKLNRELGDRLCVALCLNHLGLVAYLQCDYQRAVSLFEEAVSLYREVNDKLGISNSLQNLANVARDQGDFVRSATLYGESLILKQELGDRRGIARTIASLAEVAFLQGDYAHAGKLSKESLTLYQELGVKRGVVASLGVQAFVAIYRGDYDQALSLASESLALSTEFDAPRATAYAKSVFGLGAYAQGRYSEAIEALEEALRIFRKVDDKRNVAHTLIGLARTAYRQGNYTDAASYLEESLALSRSLDIRWSLAYSLEIMGLLKRNEGSYEQACGLFQESLRLSFEQANQQGIANCLGAMAGLAALAGQPTRSVRLFAASGKMRDAQGAKMGGDDQREYEHYLDMARHQLDEMTFNATWSEAYSMDTDQAVEDALSSHLTLDPISYDIQSEIPLQAYPDAILETRLGLVPFEFQRPFDRASYPSQNSRITTLAQPPTSIPKTISIGPSQNTAAAPTMQPSNGHKYIL